MTGEEMERAIEVLLDQHAGMSPEFQQVGEFQTTTAANLQSLTGKVLELTDEVTRLEFHAEADRQEMREAVNNPIIANEAERALAEDIARLALNTSRRVTDFESKLS